MADWPASSLSLAFKCEVRKLSLGLLQQLTFDKHPATIDSFSLVCFFFASRCRVIMALNSSITFEPLTELLENTFRLSQEDMDEIGQAADIDSHAAQAEWSPVEEERFANSVVNWLKENIDDNQITSYNKQPWPGTCQFNVSEGNVFINDNLQGKSLEKEDSPSIALWDFSSPMKLVRSVEGFPEPGEFFAKDSAPERPVIMKGAARSLPAYRLWTKTYLKKKYGGKKAKRRNDDEVSLAEFFTKSSDGELVKSDLEGSLPAEWLGKKMIYCLQDSCCCCFLAVLYDVC